VNLALAGLAAVAIAGAVVAVSARDTRAATLGMLVVLLAAPLIQTPWPGPLPILARIAAALLAGRLLVIGLRGDVESGGTAIGWPAEALAAAAAAIAGFGSHGLGAAGLGPAEAQAAGFALGALAAAPLIAGRDALRLGFGAMLLLQAALLVRQGLDVAPMDGEQLVIALLTIGLGGAVAVIATAARAAGSLAAIGPSDAMGRGRAGGGRLRIADAHRPSERELAADAAASEPAAGRR
jgi:hypothetical protein